MVKLPPLILHPFSDATGPERLTDGCRAGLILEGVLPRDTSSTVEQLQHRVLAARYCEVKMLFYLGKDLLRWLGQCVEAAQHDPSLAGAGLREESFAVLLIEQVPEHVRRKLEQWGVNEHRSIFARALGMHAVFASVPERTVLSEDFLRYYYRFADQFFSCRQQLFRFPRPREGEFDFDLYASSEYARLLEREWESGRM